VSDEVLCVDLADGRIIPYPKPIALSRASWSMVGFSVATGDGLGPGDKVTMSAEDLDVRLAGPGLRLAHVLELHRDRGPLRLVPAPRSEGLAALLRLSFNHYKRPQAVFELASRLAAEVHAWRLEYTDPKAAAELLTAELAL
jgi:hypothetical protein